MISPNVSGRFQGFLKWANDVLVGRKLAVLVNPSLKVLSQRFSRDSQCISVNVFVF